MPSAMDLSVYIPRSQEKSSHDVSNHSINVYGEMPNDTTVHVSAICTPSSP